MNNTHANCPAVISCIAPHTGFTCRNLSISHNMFPNPWMMYVYVRQFSYYHSKQQHLHIYWLETQTRTEELSPVSTPLLTQSQNTTLDCSHTHKTHIFLKEHDDLDSLD